jgi:hypothetical protein
VLPCCVLREKLAFCKIVTKSLLMPHIDLVSLLTLRVPPVLTVALLIFFLLVEDFLELEVCSSVASTGSLGFPGGSLGWVGARWR